MKKVKKALKKIRAEAIDWMFKSKAGKSALESIIRSMEEAEQGNLMEQVITKFRDANMKRQGYTKTGKEERQESRKRRTKKWESKL